VRWLVAFQALRPGISPWWSRLLRPGYAHCWAMRRVWRGCWIWIEWTPMRLAVGLVQPELVREAIASADLVLVYRAPPVASRVQLPRPVFIHCASAVANAIGVWALWPTPYGLACALRKRGARRLYLSRPDPEGLARMTPRPRIPDPDPAEQQLKQEQLAEIAKRNQQVEEDKAAANSKKLGEETARRSNRVGMRGLLSGDWGGFQRGGDTGAR
jgi:hypothetical protein